MLLVDPNEKTVEVLGGVELVPNVNFDVSTFGVSGFGASTLSIPNLNSVVGSNTIPAFGNDFAEAGVVPGFGVSQHTHFKISSLLLTIHEGHSHFFSAVFVTPKLNEAAGVGAGLGALNGEAPNVIVGASVFFVAEGSIPNLNSVVFGS